MAKNLTVNGVKASIDYAFVNQLTGSRNTNDANSVVYNSGQMANGTGATTTVDLKYDITTTIAGGGSTTLDLAGSLTDVFGATITFARIKWIFINLTNDTTASGVSVGNAAATQFVNWISSGTATVKVLNNGILLLGAPGATGYAVGAGASDFLKILNDDGANVATLTICLVGSSA